MQKCRALRFRKLTIDRLAPDQIDEMWELYAAFYENVDRAQFEADLREKDCVFLGTEPRSGRVRGFSTAKFSRLTYAGRRVGVYFSGDTMVHPDYWGDRSLHRALVPALLAWRLRHPLRRLYWHLTCNGWRTFLTLAHSFPEYWPHPVRGLPDWEAGLIDEISRRQFGDLWHPGPGVVRDDVRLKSGTAPFSPEVRAVPEVQFFLERNPFYNRGDELSMVGRVNLGFFLRAASKVLRALGRRRPMHPDLALRTPKGTVTPASARARPASVLTAVPGSQGGSAT